LQTISKITSPAKHAANTTRGSVGGANRGKNSGGDVVRAVVVSVTVAVAAFVPSSVTVDGETVHVAAAGAPVQLHVTVCLEPCWGVAETVKFACCPAVIVAVDGVAETP